MERGDPATSPRITEKPLCLHYSNEVIITKPLMLQMLYNLFVEKPMELFINCLMSNLRSCSLSGDNILDIMLDFLKAKNL